MAVDMNKTIAEASLDNLHDIIVPEAIGFFPPAPGWYIIGLLLLALLFHWAIQGYKKYQKSQYKRDALKELETYSQSNKEEVIALLSLAKRVGIAAFGRPNIAKHSDDSWWDFMEQYSKAKVPSKLRIALSKLLYDSRYSMENGLYEETKTVVAVWIKTHKENKDV